MKGNEFIDTNILVYAKLEDDADKQKRGMANQEQISFFLLGQYDHRRGIKS